MEFFRLMDDEVILRWGRYGIEKWTHGRIEALEVAACRRLSVADTAAEGFDADVIIAGAGMAGATLAISRCKKA